MQSKTFGNKEEEKSARSKTPNIIEEKKRIADLKRKVN